MFPVLHFSTHFDPLVDGNPQIGLAESAGHPLPEAFALPGWPCILRIWPLKRVW